MTGQLTVDDGHQTFRTRHFLAREGERPHCIYRIEEGWACRYRLLPDGRRQITALYLPGDYCEPHWGLGGKASQPIVALTNVRVRCLPCIPPTNASEEQQSFWRKLCEMIERQTDWLVTLGCKSASEKVAHLLVDIFERMQGCGLTYGQQCAMPLTQTDIADLTGLTSVHVNRTLQQLRRRGLIELRSKWLGIPNLEALRRAAALTVQPGPAKQKPISTPLRANRSLLPIADRP